MQNNQRATIKIKNIEDEVKSKIIEVLYSFNDNSSISNWFKSNLENLTKEDLWQDEYLMYYDTWIDKMQNKNWEIEKTETNESFFKIIFSLHNQTNFSEILCLLSVLKINLSDVYFEDYYFGTYSPHKFS